MASGFGTSASADAVAEGVVPGICGGASGPHAHRAANDNKNTDLVIRALWSDDLAEASPEPISDDAGTPMNGMSQQRFFLTADWYARVAVRCWNCEAEVGATDVACSGCASLLLVRDKYRVAALCGQGAMGVVYKAVDDNLGRTVALKLMRGRIAGDPSKRARFTTECKAMAALDHPGIARIYEADVHQDQLFFTQQFVEGVAFKKLLADHATGMAPDEAAALVSRLLAALGHAHAQGIAHRDVNPNNILVEERDGELFPMLIDFGMARISDQDATRVAWGGTPGYAAPEQILEPESNDARSDLYGAGAVLYALLTGGAIPYQDALYKGIGREPRAMIKAYNTIVEGGCQLEPASSTNPAVGTVLDEALARAVAPKPDDRYQGAAEFAAALTDDNDVETARLEERNAASASAPRQSVDVSPASTAPNPVAPSSADEAQPGPSADTDDTEVPGPRIPRAWLWLGVLAIAGLAVAYAFGRDEGQRDGRSALVGASPSASSSTSALPTQPPIEEEPFFSPGGAAVADGTVFVADRGGHRIQAVAADGTWRTLAGNGTQGLVEGAADVSEFNLPSGVAAANGGVYVADTGNHRIRFINDGQVSSVAGRFQAGDADGPILKAGFRGPESVAVSNGKIYVADTGNHRIRVIDGGVVTTLTGSVAGNSDGTAASATFRSPAALAITASGAIYIADSGNRAVRKLDQGQVTTVVRLPALEEGEASRRVDASSVRFVERFGIALLGDVLFVSDPAGHRVWRVDGDDLMLVAGNKSPGSRDGYGPAAHFESPQGLASAPGTVYVVDGHDDALRIINDGNVTTLARSRRGGFAEGPAQKAEFRRPWSLVASGDALLVADWLNRRIRRVSLAEPREVRTEAGTGEVGFFNGDPLDSLFASPWDLTVASDGAVHVVDGDNHCIRTIAAGAVTTAAGTGAQGLRNGPAEQALFRWPEGIEMGSDGTVYIADSGNHVIRVLRAGEVTTLAGSGERGLQSGAADTAQFSLPAALAFADNTLYVADTGNHAIRSIHKGRVHLLAGNGEPGFVDGQLRDARFESPVGIAVRDGVLYVADSGNHRIRKIQDGVVSTIAGSGTPGWGDGPALLGALAQPADVVVADDGLIYIADAGNHLIRMVKDGQLSTIAGH